MSCASWLDRSSSSRYVTVSPERPMMCAGFSGWLLAWTPGYIGPERTLHPDGAAGRLREDRADRPRHAEPAALPQRAVTRSPRGARRCLRGSDEGRRREGDRALRRGRALLVGPRPRNSGGEGGQGTAGLRRRSPWDLPAIVGPLRRHVAPLA